MADGYIQAAPDSTGKKVDTSEITVGGVLVERQRFVLGDPVAPEQFAAVKAASTAPVTTDEALVVGLSPNGPLPAGTNTLGTVTVGNTTADPIPTNDRQLTAATDTVTATQTTAANFNATIVGAGTAGMPAGGVVSVQGVASGTAIPVSGTFWQTTQPVSGTVTADQGGTWTIGVNNFPATQPVSGTVAVSNLPSTQVVSGTVTVGNTTANPVPTNDRQLTAATDTVTSTMPSFSLDTSFGTVTTHVSKASAASCYGFEVSSLNTGLAYMHLFNLAVAPTSGATPLYSFLLPPAASSASPAFLSLDTSFFGLGGHAFSTGLAWGLSSTAATFTDAGTPANYMVHVHYL